MCCCAFIVNSSSRYFKLNYCAGTIPCCQTYTVVECLIARTKLFKEFHAILALLWHCA